MSPEETTKGPLGAFAHFAPFKSFWGYLGEAAVLFSAASHDAAVRDMAFLQYAHFTRVSAGDLRRAGIPVKERVRHGGILFFTAFNGDATEYFRAFSKNVPGPMNALWKGCVGWVSARPYPELERYIRRYRHPVNAYFHGYPLYVPGIRQAFELRADLERLVSIARSHRNTDDPREASRFVAAYRKLALVHWGNGTREMSP